MKIQHGNGTTKYGPGVLISLDGPEVARAILAYLQAHDVYIDGSRTIRVNGELVSGGGTVYVDPGGAAYHNGLMFSGRGPNPGDQQSVTVAGSPDVAAPSSPVKESPPQQQFVWFALVQPSLRILEMTKEEASACLGGKPGPQWTQDRQAIVNKRNKILTDELTTLQEEKEQIEHRIDSLTTMRSSP